MLLLITAAGLGSRFQRAGITTPKPLIPVRGRTLLEHTLGSVQLSAGATVMIAVPRQHGIPAQLDGTLRQQLAAASLHWLELDQVLPGQLATAVHALGQLLPELAAAGSGDPPLLIHNCDTGFSWQPNLRPPADAHGAMAVFPAPGEHWSFGAPDPNDPSRAIAIAEKQRISELASIGLYGFRSSQRFLADGRRQLAHGATVKGEHYVAPLLQEAISAGETVRLPRVQGVKLYGTPEELVATFALSPAEQAALQHPAVMP